MKKGFCIAGIIIGVIMIIIGLAGGHINAGYYGDYPDSYTFGADFYTDIYKVTEEAASNVADLGFYMVTAMSTVAALLGRFIAAFGAAVVCFFGYKLVELKEAEPAKEETEAEPVEAVAEAEEVEVTQEAEAVAEAEAEAAQAETVEEAVETVADTAETEPVEEAVAEVAEAVAEPVQEAEAVAEEVVE